MIIKTELVKKIKDYFNLNIYETKVWLALLSHGVSTAGEIAEISGIPRSRTYDVLESLEKAGFAIEKLGKPVKYLAVKPETVLEKLKNNTMESANEKIKILENLKSTAEFTELKELHNVGGNPADSKELSTSIKGKSNLYAQIRGLLEDAEKSVYMVSSSSELMSKQKMFTELFEKLNKRGVNVKIMVPDEDAIAKKLAKKFNVTIKQKSINARFVIADKEELIFTLKPVNGHEDFDYGVWINSEYFVNSLAYMFELAWSG
jgi:sugar-specific transcriptional regulator TrmB